jgi:porphobilinogen synthase
MFPQTRLRRLRRTTGLRRLVRETVVATSDLVMPLFVVPGSHVREEIGSLPGNYHLSVDELTEEARSLADAGVAGVLLFGVPEDKDEVGSCAYAPTGPVQEALRALKQATPDLVVTTDVCLCAYTDHGHCGVVCDGEILNDPTLELLGKMAVSHAEAGADVICPSDMMDGRVQALRAALDGAGFIDVAIMSYAAKYASAFYGPFREAAGSAPSFGDRRSYQMDPANRREALREVEADLQEGADIVMVKPALAYLDVIAAVAERGPVPVAAYCVSGEYAMVCAAAERGWMDRRAVALEMLTAVKRAGADIIITYFAKEAAKWLEES